MHGQRRRLLAGTRAWLAVLTVAALPPFRPTGASRSAGRG